MGCCGSKNRANTEYEVTLRDGTVKRAPTAGEARILARSDTTTGSKAPTIKVVPKLSK